MIKIDRKSLKKTIRKARFPSDMDITSIEKGVERDMIEALEGQGVTSGTFAVSLGDINYDVVIDKYGRRRIRRL